MEIYSQNPSYWTNLGLLYLHNEDPELANHALYKAQVLNPEYSLAWVGQAFVAIANGHLPEAKAVLEHALTLPVQIVSGCLLKSTRSNVTRLICSPRPSTSTQIVSLASSPTRNLAWQ